ncbi:hypothetical protein ROZALSC1DRAFT_27561 [Rozella allomycis CSF55]|uniref:choline-phosphate cytidylyltransferase n=1 Tax=Rozella allomycis (strain CSF55) TaxID=988480 RepID=A0A075AMY4_ROZAC|nr:Rossmann-like alpha/beta/alpha sandwich fold domain-containing protein [Rozella allomycis CSF55]RKP20992.1 hypothetical protein ROZALSC1DRAFT_27561 [Rozella allomycis CSF55]|eukprot:EPZ31109.1 Rossmann-like alpha/beta/alpha sandwich fold domain-containing protein [Rozella allomycis CSF55]
MVSSEHLNIVPPPTNRASRIYCDGIFDLFHFGHAKALEQAKKILPHVYLIVGVCGDEITQMMKGKTVMNEKERYESVRHCRWVDEVVEDAPWIITQEFLDHHKIDYVAHDDIPYKMNNLDDVYKFVKDQKRFIATKRTGGVSTSDLITRIVRDYDEYLRRNLARGVPAKELNISFMKERELFVKDKVRVMKKGLKRTISESEDCIKCNWENTRSEILMLLDKWESKSHEWIMNFTRLFKFNDKEKEDSRANGPKRLKF